MVGSRACALAVVASLFCGGPTAAAEQSSAAQMMDDLMYGRGPIGGPFTLTDQTGKQRSDSEFRGKLMIVYFGYTYCPDVCPTDLMAITQALDALGPAAEGVQPVFITIDPERDTKVLADYVSAFHHSLVGLTGIAGRDSKDRQCLQGVLCKGAGRAERGLFNRPCRRHLFDGPPWRVSGLHAATDKSRPVDRGTAQKSRELTNVMVDACRPAPDGAQRRPCQRLLQPSQRSGG